MHKVFPIALLAVMLIGCKGGETTAATTGGGGGAAASPDQTYSFKFSPKEGEKYKYMMTLASQGRNMEQGFTIACEKVADGKFTMVTSLDSMKMDGQEAPKAVMDSMKNMKSTSVMDGSGKVHESKTEGAPGGAPTQSPTPTLPGKPIKIGDSWDGSTKVGDQEVKYSYKLVGVANEGGTQIATIEATASNIPGGGTFDGPMILKIDMATGMPHSMNMKTKSKDATGKEISATMEMKRI